MDIFDGRDLKGLYITEEQYGLLTDLICREFGIVMKGDKRMLLHTKLSHRLSILGISSYTDYYNFIISEPSKEELFHLISHITNNETFFMREASQLGVFRELLPDIKRQKQKKTENAVNILSAGCSTGEEVYTLNIILIESGLFAWGWDISVTGIDCSRTALKKAKSASYTEKSFRSINGNRDLIEKYFSKKDDRFVLKKPYHGSTGFKHGNILDPASYEGGTGMWDVIFSRNVLIYMSDPAIAQIAKNFYNHLSDDGYLFLGSSESFLGKTDLFVPEYREGAIIYRKNPSVSA